MSKQKRAAAALGVALLCAVSATRASIISITDVPPVTVTGTAGTDYLVYQVEPANAAVLQVNNSAPVLTVLSGNKTQTSPGGNVRLYAGSDVTSLVNFNTASHVILSGTLNGHSVSASSLNGTDWFTTPSGYNTAYGVNDKANTWFNAFLAFYKFDTILTTDGFTPTAIAAEKVTLFNDFRDYNGSGGNGFQHLSGPSISYIQEDTSLNQINVGLADTDGYLYPLVAAAINNSAGTTIGPIILSQLPSDIYASKATLISIDGGTPTFDYSFAAVPSGLTTSDGTSSDNLEFQVSVPAPVPEPASATLMVIGGIATLTRRGSGAKARARSAVFQTALIREPRTK